MIKNVTAKGFKGLDFDQPLYPKTIICGPNGSGKSARSMAINLAILGYVPGSEKTNPAILHAFGKEKLSVGIRVNGTKLDRYWKQNKKGAVNQTFMVDTKKSGKDAFISALAEAGNPRIFDLSIFMDLSDQKKIDYLFNVFPPAGDVSKLDDSITDLSEKLNSKRKDIRDSESFVQKTMTNRAQIDLPSGTLAEISDELKKTKEQLNKAWDDLKKAEIEKAEAEQKAKSEKEAAEKAERELAERELKEISDEANLEAAKQESQTTSAQVAINEGLPRYEFKNIEHGPGERAHIETSNGAAASIKKIIAAIDSVGCGICSNGAAKMVARSELRKYV